MSDVLIVYIRKEFVGNEFFNDYMISIAGYFNGCAFSYPYKPEEFSQELINRDIDTFRAEVSEVYGVPKSSIRVKVNDFRYKQTNLKRWLGE